MVSGLYERVVGSNREELRLDVDGTFPQMAASGTTIVGGAITLHWVAGPLSASVDGNVTTWKGGMWKVWSASGASLPFNEISLVVTGSTLKATLKGAGNLSVERTYEFRSRFFRTVELEYDVVDGITAPLTYQTDTHPDRPAGLTVETLTIDELFTRAGFRVIRGGDTTIPTSGTGTNGTWSNAELHDAMLDHWSRTDKTHPGWSLWTIFADQHDDGFSLGGIMFDSNLDPGDPHDYGIERQGTAVFMNSFISQAPASESARAAWVQRMQFWCAVHEMGHAFNLLHSWDKGFTQGEFFPWIPEVTGGSDLLTFMNYPFRYRDGLNGDQNTIDFFRDFPFRFTDAELTFMRHAPEPFVQMGGERFGTNHAFEKARRADVPQLELVVRTNKEKPEFEFLEPVSIELKLTNLSTQPLIMDANLLFNGEGTTILIGRDGRPYRTWHPHLHACYQPTPKVLAPGESIYESIFVSSGKHGWHFDEPGYYTVQANLQYGGFDIVSDPLRVRILPPLDRAEEVIAQDFFSGAVGKVLAMDGTRLLTKANDVLAEVATRFSKRAAAIHATMALSMPTMDVFKEVTQTGKRTKVVAHAPTAEGTNLMAPIFTDPATANRAAATLGHIDFKDYGTKFCTEAAQRGKVKLAKEGWETLVATLQKRKVLETVVQEVKSEAAKLGQNVNDKPRRRGKARRPAKNS